MIKGLTQKWSNPCFICGSEMVFFRRFMRCFFHHFYHNFAWTYDFVASIVSIGRWDEWVQSVIPFIHGDKILEIGHGPGHLQELLYNNNRLAVGLDESLQMGKITKRRLLKAGHSRYKLSRGRGENLPFAADTFDTIVSTFPTEYIFDELTLTEIHRVLHEEGQIVILPAAWIVGQSFFDLGAAWLFRITGQVPAFPQAIISQRLKPSFEKTGFNPVFQTVEIKSSIVLIVIANKLTGGI